MDCDKFANKHGFFVKKNCEKLLYLGQIKNMCVRDTYQKILGGVGTHIFLMIFFWKKYNFVYFERHFAFQNA